MWLIILLIADHRGYDKGIHVFDKNSFRHWQARFLRDRRKLPYWAMSLWMSKARSFM